MAWSLVQSKIMSALADPGTTSFDSTPTAGNLLLAITHNTTNASIPVVSDSNGNWTELVSIGGGVQSQSIHGLIAVDSQPTAITCDTGSSNTGMSLYEFSGNQASLTGIVHQSATASVSSASTTNGSQPSITTTEAGCLVVASIGMANTITSPSLSDGTFSAGQAGPSGAIESVDYYKLDAAAATYNPYFSWTTNRASTQIVIALLPATATNTTNFFFSS